MKVSKHSLTDWEMENRVKIINYLCKFKMQKGIFCFQNNYSFFFSLEKYSDKSEIKWLK